MIHLRCCPLNCSFLDYLYQKEDIRTVLDDAAQRFCMSNRTTVHHCGI